LKNDRNRYRGGSCRRHGQWCFASRQLRCPRRKQDRWPTGRRSKGSSAQRYSTRIPAVDVASL
jgi:hypothetical protein